ncbi:hypothetical protein SFUMM280S_04884 [Streptomyces fumanus]
MYTAHPDRYADMPYRRTGRSGLKLPALSLGLWHNFGPDRPVETQRAILRRAFDLGVTHFDLANNYGPPPGAAESALGAALRADFAPYRDELVISTKAGYLMWPGPYGEWGSRKYLLSSLDQSLRRMGLEYVDISTPTAPTRRLRWRRRWARCTPRCSRARPSTSASPTTRRSRPARPPASSPASAPRS